MHFLVTSIARISLGLTSTVGALTPVVGQVAADSDSMTDPQGLGELITTGAVGGATAALIIVALRVGLKFLDRVTGYSDSLTADNATLRAEIRSHLLRESEMIKTHQEREASILVECERLRVRLSELEE